MGIHKITYSSRFRRAGVYNWGCNFNCIGCSYKLKPPYQPGTPFLGLEKVKEVLGSLDVERVHFLGGEPTLTPNLAELARFARNELDAYTKIGHSNGSVMPPRDIDAMSISIKAYTDSIHVDYTGVSNVEVLRNFIKIYDLGVELDASSVFIPGYIDCEETEKIARFIADIDPKIPYHSIGYIPVPGAQWRRPTPVEVERVAQTARKHLSEVTFSCLSPDEALNLRGTDPRYRSVRVA